MPHKAEQLLQGMELQKKTGKKQRWKANGKVIIKRQRQLVLTNDLKPLTERYLTHVTEKRWNLLEQWVELAKE